MHPHPLSSLSPFVPGIIGQKYCPCPNSEWHGQSVQNSPSTPPPAWAGLNWACAEDTKLIYKLLPLHRLRSHLLRKITAKWIGSVHTAIVCPIRDELSLHAAVVYLIRGDIFEASLHSWPLLGGGQEREEGCLYFPGVYALGVLEGTAFGHTMAACFPCIKGGELSCSPPHGQNSSY